MSASADLQAYLTAQGIVDGSSDWPSTLAVMHEGLPDSPVNKLVAFAPDGGILPEIPADGITMGSAAWRRPQVQVRVRGEPGAGPVDVLAKHEEIYQAVHGLLGETLGATEYAGVFALSEVLPLGTDENQRYEATISYQMVRPVREPASV